MNMFYGCLVVIAVSAVLAGCMGGKQYNDGLLQSYPVPAVEAGWIRNGNPVEFDGIKWYPVDDYENLLDGEVYQVGEYQGVILFVEKTDAKPYQRIYTKFAKGKFRYFERRSND